MQMRHARFHLVTVPMLSWTVLVLVTLLIYQSMLGSKNCSRTDSKAQLTTVTPLTPPTGSQLRHIKTLVSNFSTLASAVVLDAATADGQSYQEMQQLMQLQQSMYCAAGKHLETLSGTKIISAGNISVHVYAGNDYVSQSLQNTPPFWDINGVEELLWALEQFKSEKQQQAAQQLRARQAAAQANTQQQQQQQQASRPNRPLVVDVGAHVGWYGFSAAVAGSRTAFFEAMPANIQLLRRSICSSAWLADRITLYGTGLSNKSAECSIISEDLNQGNGITICDQDAQQGVKAVTATFNNRFRFLARDKITVRRLDALLSEEVQVMKIDVEGHEKQMVQGAEGLLSTSNGGIVWYIMANFNRALMSQADQLWYLQFLDRMGYKISEKSFKGPFYDAEAVKSGTVKVEHEHPDLFCVRKELG